MLNLLQTFLSGLGMGPVTPAILRIAGVAVAVVAAALSYLAARGLLVPFIHGIRGTATRNDDILVDSGLLKRATLLVPLVVLQRLLPPIYVQTGASPGLVGTFLDVALILVALLVTDGLINALILAAERVPRTAALPLRGLFQAAKLVAVLIAAILVLSALFGRNPGFFLGGLGALTAVLMLIFKDAILGFVAGIQLSTMDMVRVGDWIEMPKYGADGDVIDVALTTVKVRNWDKTITCIPTYALIADSFKNWRGMSESGGRRIKRAVAIDMQTIRFCDRDMLERFARIRYISEYIAEKRAELAAYNRERNVEDEDLVNARRLTNVGTFRAYVVAYLRNHPQIHRDMTFLVRQLAPGENGLPIEIYVFTTDTRWAVYEGIQADIFDHILAVAPEFDLRVYQQPSGNDVREAIARPMPARG